MRNHLTSSWKKISLKVSALDDDEPRLPRQQKLPKRFNDEFSSDNFHHEHPKTYFSQIYFEAVDCVIECIRNRFDQPGVVVSCVPPKFCPPGLVALGPNVPRTSDTRAKCPPD